MTDDAEHMLHSRDWHGLESNEQKNYVPVYEGRMIFQYDHRYTTFKGEDFESFDHLRPTSVMPNFYILESEFKSRVLDNEENLKYFFGIRRVSNSTNERTVIASVFPYLPSTYGITLLRFNGEFESLAALQSSFNAFVFDYLARNAISQTSVPVGAIKQLPVLPPSTFTPNLLAFITPRVLELTYTAHDLTGFARDLGYDGDPFTWDDERRFYLRAELDALYFILYGIGREDVAYIMDTFPIVRKKDLAAHDAYRTKDEILAVYDQLTQLGLENLGYYVSAWDVPAEVPLGPEASKDDNFRQAVLSKAVSYPYICKTFHQTRVYNLRGFEQRRTVKDWEDIIEDAEP